MQFKDIWWGSNYTFWQAIPGIDYTMRKHAVHLSGKTAKILLDNGFPEHAINSYISGSIADEGSFGPRKCPMYAYIVYSLCHRKDKCLYNLNDT